MSRITVTDIRKMKKQGKRIPVLTAYTYSIARVLDSSGIPIVLVGDSGGMVEAGLSTTLPVTMDEMIYHTRAVARACSSAMVVSDMPFMSYQASIEDAIRNAGRLVKEGGATAVKVEGGVKTAAAIKAIVSADIPVMGHIGLTPQSVLALGGYKVQGREKSRAEAIIKDAKAVEKAGAFAIVLECVPMTLASRITRLLKIPSIGIGAGPSCDGQVLVVNDMLGLSDTENLPRFVKKYANLNAVIKKAVIEYKEDVENGDFPSKEHCY
ncbi:MAG: 3-methyl-2-oxobutanoate hydroxymethyltransferase [Thermodesulfobacteriota bacterium]